MRRALTALAFFGVFFLLSLAIFGLLGIVQMGEFLLAALIGIAAAVFGPGLTARAMARKSG